MTKRDFIILAESFALACDLFSSQRFAKDSLAFARALATQYPRFNQEKFLAYSRSCHATRTYPTLKGNTK